jgi:hypothetical protein
MVSAKTNQNKKSLIFSPLFLSIKTIRKRQLFFQSPQTRNLSSFLSGERTGRASAEQGQGLTGQLIAPKDCVCAPFWPGEKLLTVPP